MQGLGSKAVNFGGPDNKKKFVSQLLDDDLELNWYQYRFRNHDPQIGRFWQVDPLATKYVYNSTYAYAENRVINGIDLEGLEWYPASKIFSGQVDLYGGTYRPNESTNPNYQAKSNALPKGVKGKVHKKEPLISLNVSVGKQLGVKAGGYGVEANFGSRDLISLSDQGVKSGDPKQTKEGMTLNVGAVNLSGESTSSTETVSVNTDLGKASFERTTTVESYKLSTGIKGTPFDIGIQRDYIYEQYSQNGISGQPMLVYDSRQPTLDHSQIEPEIVSPSSNSLNVSVTVGFKLEVSINVFGILGLVHN